MRGTSVKVRPWSAASELPALEADMVHVWSASLGAAPSTVQSLLRTLTPDEVSRAERFHFQKDREHFIVARGLLRSILSRYLDTEPSQLRFCYCAHGKPVLDPVSSGRTLRFNLSHSNGLALYAITSGGEIGVDIEYMRADFPGLEVADQFFSAREIVILRALPSPKRQEVFFTFWTLKEALIKAKGEGLALDLDAIDMSAVVETLGDSGQVVDRARYFSGWSLQKLMPAPGYIGAVAVEGEIPGRNRGVASKPASNPPGTISHRALSSMVRR
jgi:4'-phosphopantetheinyl transferase